jgi:hypothetical protein
MNDHLPSMAKNALLFQVPYFCKHFAAAASACELAACTFAGWRHQVAEQF